jgi:hypothetical protein
MEENTLKGSSDSLVGLDTRLDALRQTVLWKCTPGTMKNNCGVLSESEMMKVAFKEHLLGGTNGNTAVQE